MIDQAQRLRQLAGSEPAPRRERQERTGTARDSSCVSIAVTSGKGGVGKSNMALMISVALAAAGKKVLLLDADLGLANIHILLGLAPKYNVSHVIERQCSLDDIICSGPGGINIIPGASGLESMANLEPLRLEMLRRQLSVVEQRHDFIIVDTSAGIGRATTGFAAHSDVALLVMTPEPTSLADAYAMVKVLYEKGATTIPVLVNMATSEREGREVFDRLNALVVKFLKRPLELAEIAPYDAEVPRLIKRQKVFSMEHPRRPLSARVQSTARKLAGLPPVRQAGLFSRMFGIKQ